MLFVRRRIAELGMHLFQRPVHPELLEQCTSRIYERDSYRLRTVITSVGHCIIFQTRDICVTEICAGMDHDLPQNLRLVSRSMEAGQCEQIPIAESVYWSSKFSIDSAEASVLLAIQRQLDKQGECEGLVYRFHAPGKDPLGGVSYINFQAFARSVLIRTFHTFPDSLTVARSESRFSLASA